MPGLPVAATAMPTTTAIGSSSPVGNGSSAATATPRNETADPVRIACIGAGPAAAMLVERIVAGRSRTAPGVAFEIHLIDPHEPGGGRIWRRGQSPLLKLNSMLEDVAFFTDASCALDGPVAPGPSLAEWVRAVRSGVIARPEWSDPLLDREVDTIGDRDFPTRRLNNAYLGWALGETLRRAAQEGAVISAAWHPCTALDVEDVAGAHPDRLAPQKRVRLDSGETVFADIVVYALGHSGAQPSNESIRLGSFADRHGLEYIAPAFTADVDLDGVAAGSDVIVRGMGLAAIDLVVLLTEGRGGSFARDPEGVLHYRPSGSEPVLHLGSRRGVPYRSKITSRIAGDPVALEYLGREFHERVRDRRAPLDFDADVWPLVAAELVTGYYRELFTGHPERVSCSWEEFAPGLRDVLAGTPEARAAGLTELVERSVPVAADRFDLDAFDRPLEFAAAGAGPERATPDGEVRDDASRDRVVPDRAVRGGGASGAVHVPGAAHGPSAVHDRVRAHVAEDLRQRTSQEHSATQGLFMTALHVYLSIAEVAPERWNARSRTRSLPGRWHTFFSYLASGPPGHRLEELVALADAGVVRFLGGDVELVTDERSGTFRASGVATVGTGGDAARSGVAARTLIDAWLPEARAATSDNPLLCRLVARGRLRELAVSDPVSADAPSIGPAVSGPSTTGRIEVDPEGRLPGIPGEFALGPFVAGPTGGAFTRPGLNSLPFRIHDRCAQAILSDAAALAAAREARCTPVTA